MSSHSEMTILARRYALAVFELAEEAQVVQKVIADLREFYTLFRENSDLQHMILSPSFDLAVKKDVLKEILEKVQAHLLSGQFLEILLQNGRVDQLDEICRIYDSLNFQGGYKKSVVIRSAVPLTQDQYTRLQAVINEKLSRDVTLEIQEDPTLLAGVVINLGNTLIDSTLKTKIDKLSTSMKGAHS